MRSTASEIVVLAGAVLVLVAGIGVLRFRPALSRLHALTKASTLGVVLVRPRVRISSVLKPTTLLIPNA